MRPTQNTFQFQGHEIDLADVASIDRVKYKVPRYMSAAHCAKYGLTPDMDGEFWILGYCKRSDGSIGLCQFKDESVAKLAEMSLRHALERFHRSAGAWLDMHAEIL